MLDASYRAGSYWPVRYYDNLKFALRPEIQGRTSAARPNWLEKLGSAQLWFIENLPGKLVSVVRDPRVVTLALTALALYAVTYGFYREITRELTRKAIEALPEISTRVVRFAAWLYTVNIITGYHNRAQGRFCNKALTEQFWPKKPSGSV